jgi:TolB-like protein/tetratricopeptide (TPR) repeat protein/tRNA A-37 threonylcarbamoyl transferase component Bud32
LAEGEVNRDPEREGETPPPVPPGALSALLQELAHVADEAPQRVLPEPGAVIGRFEILREIGGGGFGVVYEARDQKLHRSVAFKLVRPGRLELGEDLLAREAEVVAQLSHPNLVTLFDVGRCDHGPYLVLELLRGETLHERRRSGPLPLAEAVHVAAEIARGLAHAHGKGVVHRDLKPSNVFLCEDGRVKLLDFGMARAFGRRRVSGGTPAYMAPEQWREAPEDERTDVYALGVMLFEMLAGELPFPGDDRGKATLSDRKAPPLDVPASSALGGLVARMLEKDATARPRDGDEVLRALSPIEAELRPSEGGGRTGPPPPRVRRPGRVRWLATGAVVLAVALGVLSAWKAGWLRRPAAPARARAIVVLPFANLSGSAENEYFSDGLTEEILNLLNRLRELRVAARTSSFYFKGKNVEIADVARRLGVDVVLEGSVRRDRDRVRIAAELVDARSGFHIWSQTYDRKIEDVFAIQEDIARQVVGGLEIVLTRASEGELRKPRGASLEAYDLYLRGRAQLRLERSAQTLDRATALLEQAVAADPGFAKAYAGLCETWLIRYEVGHAAESFDRAERACATALGRDPGAGEVQLALGNLNLLSGRYAKAEEDFGRAAELPDAEVDALLGLARTYLSERRFAEAEATFDRAVRLDPGYWRVHLFEGNYLLQVGRYAEAAQSYAQEIARTPEDPRAHSNLGVAYYRAGDFEKAAQAWKASLELSPTSFAYANVGTISFYLGRFGEAAAMYERAVELAPKDHRNWGALGDAYAAAPGGEPRARAAYEKAIELCKERLRVNAADSSAIAELAHYHASLGHAKEARQLAAEALKVDPDSAYVHYNAALVNAHLGQPDAALDEIERAIAHGYQRNLLPRDPGLEPIRGRPRFQALASPPAK